MSRYLVTGCAGFIGSHLTDTLLSDGHDVVGIDCFTDYYEETRKRSNLESALSNRAFDLLELDLADADLAPLVDGIDGVFHLAAQAGVRTSWGDTFAVYARNNILATQRVFEAAASAGVRVAFASSSSVYGDAETYPTHEEIPPRPLSPYGVSKLSCEELARAYGRSSGLDVVSLRYFTVYGPRQRPDMAFSKIFAALIEGRSFQVYGDGRQSRDFTYVDDAVAATIGAFERGGVGCVYNVGGGTEATLRDVIALAEELAETRLDVEWEPVAAGDPKRTSADTSRLRSEVGWEPRTTLADGLARELEYWEAFVRPTTSV